MCEMHCLVHYLDGMFMFLVQNVTILLAIFHKKAITTLHNKLGLFGTLGIKR